MDYEEPSPYEILFEKYEELVERVEKLEQQLSVGHPFKKSTYPDPQIVLYIDLDTALYKEDMLREGSVNLLRWCSKNFSCSVITSISSDEFMSRCLKSNAADLVSQIEIIKLDDSKKSSIIDIYDDFYCVTTKKYPSSLTELYDTHNNERIIKVNGLPIDKIKEKIRDSCLDRIHDKIQKVNSSPESINVFSLYKRSGYWGTRGRGWYFIHAIHKNYRLQLDFICSDDFAFEWSFRKMDRDGYTKESETLHISNTYGEILRDIEGLPKMLEQIDKRLSGE